MLQKRLKTNEKAPKLQQYMQNIFISQFILYIFAV